jgi:hypothetical protein
VQNPRCFGGFGLGLGRARLGGVRALVRDSRALVGQLRGRCQLALRRRRVRRVRRFARAGSGRLRLRARRRVLGVLQPPRQRLGAARAAGLRFGELPRQRFELLLRGPPLLVRGPRALPARGVGLVRGGFEGADAAFGAGGGSGVRVPLPARLLGARFAAPQRGRQLRLAPPRVGVPALQLDLERGRGLQRASAVASARERDRCIQRFRDSEREREREGESEWV